MNKIIIIGRLGAKPEHKKSVNDKDFTKFSVATEESYGKGKDAKKDTTWHNCQAWDGIARYASNMGKGDLVVVEGRAKNQPFEKNGVKSVYPYIAVDRLSVLSSQSKRNAEEAFGGEDYQVEGMDV